MEFKVQSNVVEVKEIVSQKVDWGTIAMMAPQACRLTKGKGVKVAILDTGIDKTHPDLAPNLKGGINFAAGNMSAFDDRQGHGTHCAGIIAGCDNDIGIVGIAPQADIYAVKVLGDDGTGSLTNIIRAIDWCIQTKMDVISMSLGGSGSPPPAFHEVFKRAHAANIPVIVATDNENEEVSYPAAYPETIAVGAMNERFELATFSNHGKTLDVMAPGVDICSTLPVNAYGKMSGTSMATPMVAGAVALYIAHKRSKGESYTVQQIHNAIKESAVDLGIEGYDTVTGHGLLNLSKLLSL